MLNSAFSSRVYVYFYNAVVGAHDMSIGAYILNPILISF